MNDFLQQIHQFHFLRPWWLLALVPAAIIIVLLWQRKAAYGSWQRVISPHLLPHLLAGNVARQSKLPLILLALGWLLGVVAMAGPTWQQLPQAVQKKIQAQIIVMDLSLSMYSKDLPPSRLVRARMKLSDILEQNDEGLTALIVYAGTPHVVTPLTDDNNTILSMLNGLNPDIMPIKGSQPADAVKKAVDLLHQAGVHDGRILLITDDLPKDFKSDVSDVIGYRTPLSILGVGTTEGAPIELEDGTFVKKRNGDIVLPRLDISGMKSTARALNARFSTISATNDDIDYLLAPGLLPNEQEVKDTGREFDVWEESGQWLVLLLLPLAAAGYRKGWLGGLLLPALIPLVLTGYSNPAQAFEWKDLWQTRDQQAQDILNSGNPQAAAEQFKNPDWKASSLYKAGDYEAAAAHFSQKQDADSYYNLGNAQAKQQKLDEAIASYEKALEMNPEMADAKSNLDLVKQVKEQQQKQDNQNQSEDSDNKSDKSDSNQENSDQNQSDQDKQDKNNENQNNDDQDESEPDQQPSGSSDQNQDDEKQDSQQQQPNQDQGQHEDQDQDDRQQPGQEQEEEQQSDQESQQPLPSASQPQPAERTEDQQALEQWLRRIPDDPGGLLRRKFERETQLRNNTPSGEQTW